LTRWAGAADRGDSGTKDDQQILDYAPPPRGSFAAQVAKRVAVWIVVAIILFAAAVALPHPTGIWYFGRNPQWLVAIDSAGLTIGRSDEGPRTSGWVPVIVAKLLVYGLPVWLMWRYALRPRRKQAF
jgi:hypothetical protein